MSPLSGGQMHLRCRGCFIISFSLSNSHRSTFLYFTISKPSLLHPPGLVTWVLIEFGTGWARNLAWCDIDLIPAIRISTNIPMISNDSFKVNCNGWILHNKRVRTSYKLSLMITKQRSVFVIQTWGKILLCSPWSRQHRVTIIIQSSFKTRTQLQRKIFHWDLRYRLKIS